MHQQRLKVKNEVKKCGKNLKMIEAGTWIYRGHILSYFCIGLKFQNKTSFKNGVRKTLLFENTYNIIRF